MKYAREALKRLFSQAIYGRDKKVADFLLSCDDASEFGGFDLLAEADRIEDEQIKADMATVYEQLNDMHRQPMRLEFQYWFERLKIDRQLRHASL